MKSNDAAPAWFLPEEQFLRTLALERKRTDRSHECFMLMLMKYTRFENGSGALDRILELLNTCTRETDVKGWYKACSVVGVVFTGIGASSARSAAAALSTKVSKTLAKGLSAEQIKGIQLSFHLYPEDWEEGDSGGSADLALYPDLLTAPEPKRRALLVKRAMDVMGSLAALLLLAPVLVTIAVLIKLGSKGPVLFRQTRIGQYGRRFTFLKFRSMYSTADPRVHEEYVKKYISGRVGEECVFKLTNDPRVTRLGRFLRKTSLDELPQFFNVLTGEMSLVGPRPPIPYEFRRYDLWHRRRLLAVRPGITGLWQVEGRSRVKFDDMVRLDLTYANTWSPWMDLKILLRTPGAVLSGSGAY